MSFIKGALVVSGILVAQVFAADLPTNSTPARAEAGKPLLQGQAAPGTSLRREALSEQDREKIRAATDKYRDEQKSLYEKLRLARKDLEQTAQAEKIDEKAIREKAAVVGQIEGDLAILRAKQYHDLEGIFPGRGNAFSRTNATNNALLRQRLERSVQRKQVSPAAPLNSTPTEPK